MVYVCENDFYRANDEASYAREQLQRTFGFAIGSGAVFAPQVETYEIKSHSGCRTNPILFNGISDVCERRRGTVNSRRFSNRFFSLKHVFLFRVYLTSL